jgi:hypothetical protein
MTNVIVPQLPNKAIVLASQLGKAVSEDSAIGPHVFQTVHYNIKMVNISVSSMYFF